MRDARDIITGQILYIQSIGNVDHHEEVVHAAQIDALVDILKMIDGKHKVGKSLYLNKVRVDGRMVYKGVSAEEWFSPFNPVYKKVQEFLANDGWHSKHNFIFERRVEGRMQRINFYSDEAKYFELRSENSMDLHEISESCRVETITRNTAMVHDIIACLKWEVKDGQTREQLTEEIMNQRLWEIGSIGNYGLTSFKHKKQQR